VLRVYHSWRHLDDRPFRVLAYMALRARDHDAEPWYGAGHDELALIALGLAMGTERERDAGHRTVRRAFTVLHKAGAIRTARHARPGRQATYRLFLDGPTQDGERPVNNPITQDGERPMTIPERRTVSDLRTSVRRTVSDRTQDGERPTKEEEEEELQGQERISPEANLRTANCGRQPVGPVNGYAKPAIRADSPTP